ncbi:MAG: O-antigen ligase family protein [Candidatus Peribacteraceae bacterium]|nr:O-antigen ligase family protein [Candidatus Peribacteraceae bacterium]MDD5742257.1 O-antigen ligase family protein [Candidatus Peribacteraceae bacterium]
MLQHFRERLTLLLIALLPLHAFLVTVGTKLLAGKGHAPLAYLAIWKEALLGVILVLAVAELLQSEKWPFGHKGPHALNGKVESRKLWKGDAIDGLILALLLLGLVVTVFTHGDWKLGLLGLKYDFVPLIAFLIARRVPWSDNFRHCAWKVLLGVGVVVAAYGILTAFLPMQFFLWLGYSPAHSLYFADGPLAAFQQVSDTGLRRIQSTMSGPNQLGLWLLLPLSVCLVRMFSRRAVSDKRLAISMLTVCILFVSVALFLTFSRAAWIAAFVIGMVVILQSVPRRLLRSVAVGAVLIVVGIAVIASFLFPSVFFRLSSSRGHLVRPLQAIGRMAAHPFGEGLGAAGPASNRVSETCVFLRPQDDPSWAKTTPSLCVFLGSTQVQPADHVCRCPFLPENWYLQIGVEMGVAGFTLFLVLVVVVLRRLRELGNSGNRELGQIAFLVFLDISIAALFLHAWEDSAVSYTVWLLSALQLPLRRSEKG